MKQILISDGACIKQVLFDSPHKKYDRVFIGNKDVSESDHLLSVFQYVENKTQIDPERMVLILSGIISKCLFLYGNEEDLHIDLCVQGDITLPIKRETESGNLYCPSNVWIEERTLLEPSSYDSIPDSIEEKEKKESKNEVDNPDKEEQEDIKKNCQEKEDNSLEDNASRIEEILSMTKGMSFEKDGRTYSKKQMDMIVKLLKSRKKFTVSEIVEATGLNYHTIYSRKKALLEEKQLKENLPKPRPERKKDSTATAKEERERELLELAEKFHPVFDCSGKNLTTESEKELKDLFTDKNRNWKISEICNATKLKKSTVTKAFDSQTVVPDVVDQNLDPDIVTKDKMNMDKRYFYYNTEDRFILDEAELYGIFPNGNIITDAGMVFTNSMSERDKDILRYAFYDARQKEFDSDVARILIKNNFTYIDKIGRLKPIFQFFKTVCTK